MKTTNLEEYTDCLIKSTLKLLKDFRNDYYQELEERELKTACLCSSCRTELICLHDKRETHEVSLCEDCAGE